MRIDELDLCKLIADELANHGPHDEQEVYGMLILLLRLRDGRQDKPSPSVSDAIEQVFRNTHSLVHASPVTSSVQSKQDTILPPTKMRAQDRDALHIRILGMLETEPLTTRQVCTRLGIAIDDKTQRDIIGAHLRWLYNNVYITNVNAADTTKRNALWRVHGAK